MIKTAVLIIGGGPIGLTLGHFLMSWHIPCIIVERNASTTEFPKMDVTNGRSMELFRKIDMVNDIRAAGVAAQNNFDVAWVTSMNGYELHRFRYPAVTQMWQRIRDRNDGTMPAEPAQRISQIVVEPLLKQALEKRAGADVRFATRFESLQQDSDGVTAVITDTATSDIEIVRAEYLAGCDGGGSTVRGQLGIELEGTPRVRRACMIHFRSRAYDVLQRWGIAWHYQSNVASMIAQDDDQYWTLQARVDPSTPEDQIDPYEILQRFLGTDIDAEVLLVDFWYAHLFVAERYRAGRVFLAGDAAHQYIPTGGYGMNTGIGDAMDLGWKLAATVQGWGGPSLLDSYECERRPVGLRNKEAAGEHLAVRFDIARHYEEAGDIEADTPGAAARRTALGKKIAAAGNLENEAWGIEYGYRYFDSPILEAGLPPYRAKPEVYEPSTTPGARLPSTVLPDGTMLYERIGPGFTMLVFTNTDLGDLEESAARLSIPLGILALPEDYLAIYEKPLILVRPDDHVGWRGDSAPADWTQVLQLASGCPTR